MSTNNSFNDFESTFGALKPYNKPLLKFHNDLFMNDLIDPFSENINRLDYSNIETHKN
jgi:hypothetical protein